MKRAEIVEELNKIEYQLCGVDHEKQELLSRYIELDNKLSEYQDK